MLSTFKNPANPTETGGRDAIEACGAPEATVTCPECRKEIPVEKLLANDRVCGCGHHFRLPARARIRMIVDSGSFRETDATLRTVDPLGFTGYNKKLAIAREKSGERDAVVCGFAGIGGVKCGVFAMEPEFMMGSMGCVVGEKIAALFDRALRLRLPVVGFTLSGGARMQEGLLSLMQMAKTSVAVRRHSDAGLLYIAVLTDPTMGGVTASFAMQADIILAEPGATVGFAGARVIEQTTKTALPEGFQTSESLLEHGFVDMIVPRAQLRRKLAWLLRAHEERET